MIRLRAVSCLSLGLAALLVVLGGHYDWLRATSTCGLERQVKEGVLEWGAWAVVLFAAEVPVMVPTLTLLVMAPNGLLAAVAWRLWLAHLQVEAMV